MTQRLSDVLSGRERMPASVAADAPLIIAIHGGTYTSAYFDLPGFSLLDRAMANGVPIVAIDRPGYGQSAPLPPAEATIAGQAAFLVEPLCEVADRFGQGRGVVLIGHSIGGAIAATIAGQPGDLPIVGLAVSGVGLRTPDQSGMRSAVLPDLPFIDTPPELKDMVMFGPPGSFAAPMPAAGHAADAPAPRAELLAIVTSWQADVATTLGRIKVPVHYRQAEIDRLWVVDESEVAGFARALTGSPRVDAQMMRGTGHCMDFHRIAAAFQTQQIGFALQCGTEAAIG